MVNIYQVSSKHCLKQAELVILSGDILVYPTDTLYGFGVDARNKFALKKLSKLKGRKGPWSICVSDQKMLNKYAKIPPDRMDFVMSHLPGSTTFILQTKRSDLSPSVMSKNKTIGIRIPDHPFPIKLTKQLQFPITSTSVNRTGENPLNDPDIIKKTFGNKISLIIDNGLLPHSKGSRIYDLTGKEITILR